MGKKSYQIVGSVLLIFFGLCLVSYLYAITKGNFSGEQGTKQLMSDLIVIGLIGFGGWYLYDKGKDKPVINKASSGCSHCGEQNNPDARFCIGCGEPMNK